jgi:hypothetical protein
MLTLVLLVLGLGGGRVLRSSSTCTSATVCGGLGALAGGDGLGLNDGALSDFAFVEGGGAMDLTVTDSEDGRSVCFVMTVSWM